LAEKYGRTAMQRMVEFKVFIDGIIMGQGFGWLKSKLLKLLIHFAPRPEQSEDCLTVNVRTPDLNGKLPVMVWIHGGAHQAGSSQDVFYESNTLAHHGVVIVSINYRLGIFGYFAHPELSAESKHEVSGNYGTLDQIAALRWVKENISAFGGDPENVTIFGESAGGESVLHMMASPLARGLFHKAIAQSPATGAQLLYLKRPFRQYDAAEETGEAFANAVGMGGANQIKQLRALPAEELQKLVNQHKGALGSYFPIIDGHVLPKNIYQAFIDGEQAQVPFLLGSNADETTLFFPLFQAPIPDYNDYYDHPLDRLPSYMLTEFGDDLDKLQAIYPGLAHNEDRALIAHQTDLMFGTPARLCAEESAKQGHPTYVYMFQRVIDNPRQTAGAFHASELPFVHDTPSPMFPMNEADKVLAKAMRSYWTQFAKTGNPNGNASLAKWQPFVSNDPHWMILDSKQMGMAAVNREPQYQIFLKRLHNILQNAVSEETQMTAD
jgi:para-nitrobenzyl esterase